MSEHGTELLQQATAATTAATGTAAEAGADTERSTGAAASSASGGSRVKRFLKRCKGQPKEQQSQPQTADQCTSSLEREQSGANGEAPATSEALASEVAVSASGTVESGGAALSSSAPVGETGAVSGAEVTGSSASNNNHRAKKAEPTATHNVSDDDEIPDQPADEEVTESKTTGEETGASQQDQAGKANEEDTGIHRTRSQIWRSNEIGAKKRAEKFWTVDCEGYNFKAALDHYTNVDKHIKPKDMKFIVDHREKQLCDDFGKVMRTVIRGAIHPLIDKVVTGFCQRMGMSETQKVPTVEERMFLWFSRDRALKLLNRMGPKKQVYFLNFINWDHVLTDLQSLNSRLRHCSLTEWQSFGEHYCHDALKIKEVFLSKYSAKPDTPLPKMLFVDRQTICPHVFESQEFNTACQEKDCPNYGKRMCRCFQLNVFMPETMVLATKREFERVLKNFLDDKYFSQRWMIRASNLKAGNGIQFIDSAAELETFLRYDIRRRLRGQFFIMQRYLKNPMLMGLRRFDCRMFLMVCVLTDRRVLGFLHPGYIREAQKDFDPASNDLRCHFTLPFTWDPDYNRYKGKNPEELPDYCHPYSKACGGLELPQLDFRTFDSELRTENHFISKINCMAQEIVRSMESIVFDKPGTWQLFGMDISVDNDKNPWLYDVITYPCIGEPDFFSETQNKMVPAILTEALTIAFELNQRDFATRSRLEWMDLPDIPWNKPGLITAQQNFIWLYSTSPERLLSYKEEYRIPRLHWYHQWRVTEDFNDYILYLKNFRLDSIVRTPDNNVYGRKTFDNSPVFKLKQQLKKTGFKPQ